MANVKPEGVLSAPMDGVRSEAFRLSKDEFEAFEADEQFLRDYKAKYGHLPRWP